MCRSGEVAVPMRPDSHTAPRSRPATLGASSLGRGDVPSTVKRHLSLAAQDVGTKVRSSWEDSRQRVLLWKKAGL